VTLVVARSRYDGRLQLGIESNKRGALLVHLRERALLAE
jgi:hypothetical protein